MGKWSQEKKDRYAKEARETNKAWGEKNERERREKVANAFDKSKVNSETSTSKNQSSSSKSQKM